MTVQYYLNMGSYGRCFVGSLKEAKEIVRMHQDIPRVFAFAEQFNRPVKTEKEAKNATKGGLSVNMYASPHVTAKFLGYIKRR